MSTSTHDDEAERPAKRSRVLIACSRCKRRRQKCDNATPACTNCARSNSPCTYPNHPNSSYVSQLEEKIELLEARLRQFPPQQVDVATPASMPSQQSPVATMSSTGQLASGIGLLSSCAAAEPHYFGFSSGLTLAHFVEAAIASNSADISLPSLADRPFSTQVPTAQTPLATIPGEPTSRKYIQAYLSNVQPLYPFLDEEELWRIHRELAGEEQPRDLSAQMRANLARLHLVYAIGSRCVQLLRPRKVERNTPEGHLMSAMQHIPEVMKVTSIQSVEVTLLLALHSMRSPSGASVWHLCGFAMRQCLELGLHRPRTSPESQVRLEQRRRRLFWSVYIFERKSALVLGRPFAISDKDIEVLMPESDEVANLALHRHYILLYQIHAKIRSTLHHLKCGASHERVDEKVGACLQRLEDWKDAMQQETMSRADNRTITSTSVSKPQTDSDESGEDGQVTAAIRSPNLDRTELLLEYYKARRSLLQPLLTEAGHYCPTLSDYEACGDAAGQICQHYRQLHRLSALPFTLRDLHAVVIAGFTSLYCIMMRPSLYNARRASEIGACSTVLYVIAEQWKSARRYRDAFEAVAERLMDLVSATQVAQEQAASEAASARGKMPMRSGQDAAFQSRQIGCSELQTTMLRSGSGTFRPQTGWTTAGDQFGSQDNNDYDLNVLFGDLFTQESWTDFGSDSGDGNLRDLLATEGLDWFLSG